jgi:hypothetical protein
MSRSIPARARWPIVKGAQHGAAQAASDRSMTSGTRVERRYIGTTKSGLAGARTRVGAPWLRICTESTASAR